MLSKHIKRSDQILIIGCGNSSLGADLYDDGYQNITNIDFSQTVIALMAAKHVQRSRMRWIEMNMLELDFPAQSFDVVLDKAAMDALLVDEGSVWDPKEECKKDVHRYCLCVSKCLKPKGLFLQITFAQPHFRRKYLENSDYGWTFEYRVFGTGLGYFFLVMQKSEEDFFLNQAHKDHSIEINESNASNKLLEETNILDIVLEASDF